MTQEEARRKGWTVALAGTGINLALGILYAWSILKGAIINSINTGGPDAFQWSKAEIQDPYAIACLMFAVAMILAGKLQDRFGPSITALIGGLLVGSGFILLSQTNSYFLWILGFGVMFGLGMGFAYSSATPPALKWFPPSMTGLIAGIVVGGFGLASVYISPLATYLVRSVGLQQTLLFFGIGFTVVVCGLAMLLKNPPPGYTPVATSAPTSGAPVPASVPTVNLTPSDLLKTYNFYILWFAFFIGSGAGLMVIGSIAPLATKSMGEWAFIAVAILAVGNATGRIVAGVMSDKIGRARTLFILMLFQSLLMFVASQVVGSTYESAVLLISVATLIGFNYGSNLALFPSLAKDIGGLKNFGVNYGALFTAWGIGAVAVVMGAERVKVAFGGSYSWPFIILGVVLAISALLVLTLKKPSPVQAV